ncbi:MAG: BatD family protein [Bacteroidales bacterium]
MQELFNRFNRLGRLTGMLLVAGIWPLAGFAQEVEFRASATPRVVETGERFRVSFSVNAEGENFEAPSFEHFAILSGPNMSTSTSVQIINGQMTRTVSYSYNFVLQAVEEGTFTIGEARIEVDGETYETEEMTIEVVKGAAAPARTTPAPSTTPEMSGVKDEDLFVQVITDRKEVYQGEHLIATIKLFTRLDLSGIGDRKFPSFSGFLQQEIDLPEQNYLQREVVDGKVYGTLVLRQLVLIPQRSGTLTIDPMELECRIRQRVSRGTGSIFDDFFDSFQTVSRTVSSDPVQIRVKPLPEEAPASFEGLVGRYKLDASVDRDEVVADEAVTLTLKVTGTGNLKLMSPPAVNLPPDFETYDPRVTMDINHTVSGSKGTKSFEYLMVPRTPGAYRIPPVEVSYFDPGKEQYVTWESPAFNLKVEPREPGTEGTVVTGFGKEDIRFIGKDIRFIKTGNIPLKRSRKNPVGQVWFYLAYPLLILVFIAALLLRKRRVEMMRNTELMRNRRASRQAGKRLKLAADALKRQKLDLFYEEVSRACWGYLSDKLSIPLAELNRDSALAALGKHGISGELAGEYLNTIDHCEQARYAGETGKGDPGEVYRNAMKLITALEQNLK